MTAVDGCDGPTPARALYGRSRGKALRKGQKRLLADSLPLFSIAPNDLAEGRVPSKRQIKREWPVGYEAASDLYDELAVRAAP